MFCQDSTTLGCHQELGLRIPVGTTFQLLKNMETYPHTDRNNAGKSFATSFGDHKGLLQENPWTSFC